MSLTTLSFYLSIYEYFPSRLTFRCESNLTLFSLKLLLPLLLPLLLLLLLLLLYFYYSYYCWCCYCYFPANSHFSSSSTHTHTQRTVPAAHTFTDTCSRRAAGRQLFPRRHMPAMCVADSALFSFFLSFFSFSFLFLLGYESIQELESDSFLESIDK